MIVPSEHGNVCTHVRLLIQGAPQSVVMMYARIMRITLIHSPLSCGEIRDNASDNLIVFAVQGRVSGPLRNGYACVHMLGC